MVRSMVNTSSRFLLIPLRSLPSGESLTMTQHYHTDSQRWCQHSIEYSYDIPVCRIIVGKGGMSNSRNRHYTFCENKGIFYDCRNSLIFHKVHTGINSKILTALLSPAKRVPSQHPGNNSRFQSKKIAFPRNSITNIQLFSVTGIVQLAGRQET